MVDEEEFIKYGERSHFTGRGEKKKFTLEMWKRG